MATSGYGLVKGDTVLATGTKEELEELRKKMGGEIKRMAVTKAPTAAELLANERNARTASEALTGRKSGRAPQTYNINQLMRSIPKFTGGSD